MTAPIRGFKLQIDLGGIGRSSQAPSEQGDSSLKKTNAAGSAAISVAPSVKVESSEVARVSREKIPPARGSLSMSPLFTSAPSKIRQEVEGEGVLKEIVSTPVVTKANKARGRQDASLQLEQLIKYVREEKKDDFKALVKALPKEQAPEVIKKLLSELAFDEKGKEYSFMMENLRELFPQIDTYVAHVQVGGYQGDALSTEGIRSMVKILTEKETLKMPCIVCDTYEQFEEELKKLAENPSDVRAGLIVRNQAKNDKTTLNLHVTPVYVEKTGSSFRCSITDSLGSNQIYTNVIAAKINKQISTIAKDVQIFCYYDTSRQGKSDRTNCPIFCLRDLVQLSKYKDPISLLEQSAQIFPADQQSKMPNIRYFGKLPPAMMKLTQSLSRIDGYDGGKLRESIKAKHERNGLNVMIEQRFLKYERLLIAQVVSQALSKSK